MKKLIAGNWKMNGLSKDCEDLANGLSNLDKNENAQMLVCPPFTQIKHVHDILAEQEIAIGGQDCSPYQSGAYTGDVSAEMLLDIGCSYVILGHSERRAYYNESSDTVSHKATTAQRQGLCVIICVGESEDEREAGDAESVIAEQLKKSLPPEADIDRLVIAYEPVWAIGTGKTASLEDVESMHAFIHTQLVERFGEEGKGIRILYGGSVKPENAKNILSTLYVGGVLVGGASLKAKDFLAIYNAA